MLNPDLRKRLILLTVGATRWSSVVVRFPPILLQLIRHGATGAGLRRHNIYPCHISKLNEERRPGVRTNGIHQAFPNCRKRQVCVIELDVSKHTIEEKRT